MKGRFQSKGVYWREGFREKGCIGGKVLEQRGVLEGRFQSKGLYWREGFRAKWCIEGKGGRVLYSRLNQKKGEQSLRYNERSERPD